MIDVKSVLKILYETINKNTLFGDILNPEQREFLISRSLVKSAKEGETLCEQGEMGHDLFLIINGEVEVQKWHKGRFLRLAHIKSGELFGEVAAVYDIPRIATVVTTKQTVYLQIPVEALKDLMKKDPQINISVYHRCRYRALENALRSVPCLEHVDESILNDLQGYISIESFEKDQLIIRQGEKDGKLYIILSGKARVFSRVNHTDINIALLKPGESFGERALLLNTRRAASVSSLTDLHAVSLSRDGFLFLIEKYPEIKAKFEEAVEKYDIKNERVVIGSESQQDVDAKIKAICDVFGE